VLIDDSAEISEFTNEDDPNDLHQHQTLHSFTQDVEETDDDDQDSDQQRMENLSDASDYDFEPPSALSTSYDLSFSSAVTKTSTVSCGVVNIMRPTAGGCLLVNFAAHSPHLSPEQVCQRLSSRYKELETEWLMLARSSRARANFRGHC
jgi:hypothetical protein